MMEEKKTKGSKRRARPQYLHGADANPSPGMLEGITHPGMNDVMFGRGGDTNYHIGNNSFRHVIESYSEQYWASTNRKEKSKIIAAIVSTWRTQDPPGRFLAKTDPARGDESLWHDVGDQVAGRKASKILSEMRIGKQKAEAKRKRGGTPERSPGGSPESSPKKMKGSLKGSYPDAEQGVLTSLMDITPCSAPPAAPQPAFSNPELQSFQSEGMSAELLAAPFPAISNQNIQGSRAPEAQMGVAASSNLRRESTTLWGDSIFGQLQQPGTEQQIGEFVPVAAALTGVFQDQFITSELEKRHSPAADGSHDSE